MFPILVAQLVDESTVFSFVGITIPFLIVSLLVAFVASNETRLICLGIVTAVAAVGYACIVLPGGPIIAPMLMKLAFLLVLSGVVIRLLAMSAARIPVGEPISAPRESRHE